MLVSCFVNLALILASSEEGNFPVLFNEAALTGETAPAAKFTLDIGGNSFYLIFISTTLKS